MVISIHPNGSNVAAIKASFMFVVAKPSGLLAPSMYDLDSTARLCTKCRGNVHSYHRKCATGATVTQVDPST